MPWDFSAIILNIGKTPKNKQPALSHKVKLKINIHYISINSHSVYDGEITYLELNNI